MANETLGTLLYYGKVAGVFVIGLVVIWIILRAIASGLKKTKLDPMLHKLITSTAKVVMLFVLIVATLESLGVKTASFVTILGVAGAAIALALKESLGNVAGGVIIAFTRPFVQGDLVEIGSTKGIIVHTDLLSTTMTTEEGRDTISIPNGMVSTAVITNYTRKQNLEG